MTTSTQLVVTTEALTLAQGRFAHGALRSQRQRFGVLLHSLDEDAWATQSRCSEWNIHAVVRHLCDVNLRASALLRGESPESADTTNVDPRTSPGRWLTRSEDERPRETLAVFEESTAELLHEVGRRATDARDTDVEWIYGMVPWHIAVLHVFWDAWVHERDIVLPLYGLHESPTDESRAAAIYGLTMSGLPSLATGQPLDETVVLDGDGGGTFHLDARSDGRMGRQLTLAGFPAVGNTTVTVDDPEVDGDAVPLRGVLPDVVDSLVGRDPDLGDVLHGPPERVQRLGAFRRFLLQPAS